MRFPDSLRVLVGTSVLLLLVVGRPGPAAAQGPSRPMKPAARIRFDRGMRYYQDGRLEEALKQMREAYAIDPMPDLLYALGQVERKRGQCAKAIIHYQSFLDTNPPVEQADAARLQMQRCEKELHPAESEKPATPPPPSPAASEVKPPPPPPAPAVEAPAPAPAAHAAAAPPSVPAPPPSRWYRDPVGGVLAGVGVVAIVSGAVLLGRASALSGLADRTLDDYVRAKDAAWMQPAGIGVAAAGGALLVAGVIRYALKARGESKAVVSAVSDGTRSMLVVSGRF